MSQSIRLAVCGAGAAGRALALGAKAAGGFKLVAVADAIPDRLKSMTDELSIPLAVEQADAIINDPGVDAVVIALPTHLHAPMAIAALKAGKHVLIEMPPAASSKDAKAIAKAAEKAGKVVLHACVRRFGAAEQSARQAVEKNFIGPVLHARATILRTRGVPHGTGWYHDREKSGGGALIDLGLPLFDLVCHLLAPAKPVSVFAIGQSGVMRLPVEESATVLVRMDNGASVELSVAWAVNQPPSQAGQTCRIYGDTGSIDVYTPRGPELHRAFDPKGVPKSTPLRQPKLAGHAALLRHFRDCISGQAKPVVGAGDGVRLMSHVEAMYKSIETGKSVAMD